MENRRKPVEKVDCVQLLKQISQRLIETLKPVGNRIGKMSFWGMALLCFFLRLFVVHPLGAMLALISSSIWLYWNFHGVRLALLKVLSGLTSAMGGNEQRSLWMPPYLAATSVISTNSFTASKSDSKGFPSFHFSVFPDVRPLYGAAEELRDKEPPMPAFDLPSVRCSGGQSPQ